MILWVYNWKRTAISPVIRRTFLLLPTQTGTGSSREHINGTLNPTYLINGNSTKPMATMFSMSTLTSIDTERWTLMSKKNQYPAFQFPYSNQCFTLPLPATVVLFKVEEIPWTSRRNCQAPRFVVQAQEAHRSLGEGHVAQEILL